MLRRIGCHQAEAKITEAMAAVSSSFIKCTRLSLAALAGKSACSARLNGWCTVSPDLDSAALALAILHLSLPKREDPCG